MKKKLQSNINRIDLLTDSKIGDVKGLLKSLTESLLKLGKRLTVAETEMYKKEYQEIPTDVLALTKTEFQLRQSLAQMIGEAKDTKDELQKEFKRLRREHYGNLKDIEQILVSFDQLSGKVSNVTDRQKLNDQAMASIFKVMKLDYALDNQDEVDRQNLYLMGLTNSGHAQNLDQDLDSLQQIVEKP